MFSLVVFPSSAATKSMTLHITGLEPGSYVKISVDGFARMPEGLAETMDLVAVTSPVWKGKNVIKDGTIVRILSNGVQVGSVPFVAGSSTTIDCGFVVVPKTSPAPTSIPTPKISSDGAIIIGTHPKAPTNLYGAQNPDAQLFEKRISPDEIAYVIPAPVPPIQYIEKYQDRPIYIEKENPCSILGNRDITPSGLLQPTIVTKIISPKPIKDYTHQMNWYSWSETMMGEYVTGIGEFDVEFYVEATPAPGDEIVAIGFNPGDDTQSSISNSGGTITSTSTQHTMVTSKRFDGVPVVITWNGSTARAYVSHTYRFSEFSSYQQGGAEKSVAHYIPDFEITTKNGCRAYEQMTVVKVWKDKQVTGTATIYIGSDVPGMNVWVATGCNHFYNETLSILGADPLTAGYIGKTPLKVVVNVTDIAPFDVWARDTHYYDNNAPLVVVKPGGTYNINFKMTPKTPHDYIRSCWLAGGFVKAYDINTLKPITNAITAERIKDHPALCNLWNWWTPDDMYSGKFYCEYYPNRPDTYVVELKVSAIGYDDLYVNTSLEALTRQIVAVKMVKTVEKPEESKFLLDVKSTAVKNFSTVDNIGSKEFNNDIVELMIKYTNDERRKVGLSALIVNKTLTDIAIYHSNDQITSDYMGHVSPSGETIEDRFKLFGWIGSFGENICRIKGSNMVESISNRAILSLMASDTHKGQILSPTYTDIGIGVASKDAMCIITQEFGGRE